jgi:hypothetical protein
MADNEHFEDSIGRWLEEAAPSRLPERVLDATFERTRRSRQGSAWRQVPGRLSMPRFVPALGGAAIVVAAAVVALNLMPSISIGPRPTATSPAAFTEVPPGQFVEIPDWPLAERRGPPLVWTGAELIVWGGGIYDAAGDGAAFNLEKGTWRVIAEAPLAPRETPAVAWTGTEMLIWGGRLGDSFFYDGAAYNPLNDTWRLLPPAGRFMAKDPSMLWTGHEAVVLGASGDADTTGEYIASAAYDPGADSWRTFADAPATVRLGPGRWWTGDAIVTANVGSAPEADVVARYDMAADRWTKLDVGASAAVVGIPDSEGRVRTFVDLPSEAGAPVQLLDTSGEVSGELPAFPGDPGVVGSEIGASGVWVGDQVVFEIWQAEVDGYEPEQLWALEPATRTWRRLDGGEPFPRISESVVAGDLLLLWNRPGDRYQGPPTAPRVCCVAPPGVGGSIFRLSSPNPSAVP